MNKPSQFVFIPTEEASIYLHNEKMYDNTTTMHIPDGKQIPQHIYILSDEEPKVDDWCYGMDGVFQYKGKVNIDNGKLPKKIIATTNPELWNETMVDVISGNAGAPKISQSDIEYIIGLHNGKGKEVDIDELAFKECGNDHYGKEKYRDGYKRCLQDNAYKKFTLDDVVNAYDRGNFDTLSSIDRGNQNKLYISAKERFVQSLTKEQPKSDTVMVEYEERVEEDTTKDYIVGKGQPCITWHEPKLKDGNICIVR